MKCFTNWSSILYRFKIGTEDVSLLERCPHFRGRVVCTGFNGVGTWRCVPILERCPHFRGWYLQTSMELGPEDVSLLERCPHFRGSTYVQNFELVHTYICTYVPKQSLNVYKLQKMIFYFTYFHSTPHGDSCNQQHWSIPISFKQQLTKEV